MNRSALRSIPSVEIVLQTIGLGALPRPLVVRVVRDELARIRRQKIIPKREAIIDLVRQRVAACELSRIQPVINGTGVIIHTNLGRSLLARSAMERLAAVASRYCNLEFDLEKNARGTRSAHLELALAVLCQAESATVVNNCAAALVLTLRHFIQGDRTEVIVSRGELVQIGGGFRIPEILEATGARLREVGTTNRTTAADFQRAVSARTALILKVHRSNFFMEGFVATPATEELSVIARRARLPLVEDLGSGAIAGAVAAGPGTSEPTPAEVLRSGVDLVCFSGDKLLGGPQAGVIAGKSRMISTLKNEPFYRAVRCDKLVLAALEATVELHLAGEKTAASMIPTLAMAGLPVSELQSRADILRQELAGLPIETRVGRSQARWGGGTLPNSSIDSVSFEIKPREHPAARFAEALRRGKPPVLGCLAGGWFTLDLRTVLPEQDAELPAAIRTALQISP